MNRVLRARALAVLLPALAITAACDRSPLAPDDHHQLGQVVILDRSTVPHTPLATWNHASGWDRTELMTISHATEEHRTRVSLGAQMFTRGGEQIELSSTGEYSFRYGVESDPDNVIDMDASANLFHGDHVHIYGYHEEARTGTASVVFALWHGDHDDGLTDPIQVRVTE